MNFCQKTDFFYGQLKVPQTSLRPLVSKHSLNHIMERLTAEQRKRRIVESATALFSQHGFKGTKTREIAAMAKVSEALLFKHFPTKESLYEAILEAKIQEKGFKFLTCLPIAEDPEKFLNNFALGVASNYKKDPSFLRLILFSSLEEHKLSDLYFGQRTRPFLDFLKAYLEEMMKIGKVRKMNVSATAISFLNMIFGCIQAFFLFKIPEVTERPLKKVLKQHVDIFMKGISTS